MSDGEPSQAIPTSDAKCFKCGKDERQLNSGKLHIGYPRNTSIFYIHVIPYKKDNSANNRCICMICNGSLLKWPIGVKASKTDNETEDDYDDMDTCYQESQSKSDDDYPTPSEDYVQKEDW